MQANAIKVQRRLQKARTPAQHAADVVEHTLATDGEDYMDTAEHLYSWWQLALLDVYLFLLLCILACLCLISSAVWALSRGIRSALKAAAMTQKQKTV